MSRCFYRNIFIIDRFYMVVIRILELNDEKLQSETSVSKFFSLQCIKNYNYKTVKIYNITVLFYTFSND